MVSYRGHYDVVLILADIMSASINTTAICCFTSVEGHHQYFIGGPHQRLAVHVNQDKKLELSRAHTPRAL